MTRTRLLELTAAGALAFALATALAVPPEQTQGEVARLLFAHVPSIWIAYVAFAVTLGGSAAYLRTRRMKWDRLAGASAEVGVFFTGATIVIGMIWAKPIWGVWWTWDARLVLTATMFFVYLGYLALRRAIPDPTVRAKRSAVWGMLAIVQIPIVHFSVIWWRTLHQPPSIARPGDVQMDAPYWGALWIGVVGFTVLAVALVRRRMELSRIEEQIDAAVASGDQEVAGAAIDAPQLESALLEGSGDHV